MATAATEKVRKCVECGEELPAGSRSDRAYCFGSCRTKAFRRNHGIDRASAKERRNG